MCIKESEYPYLIDIDTVKYELIAALRKFVNTCVSGLVKLDADEEPESTELKMALQVYKENLLEDISACRVLQRELYSCNDFKFKNSIYD